MDFLIPPFSPQELGNRRLWVDLGWILGAPPFPPRIRKSTPLGGYWVDLGGGGWIVLGGRRVDLEWIWVGLGLKPETRYRHLQSFARRIRYRSLRHGLDRCGGVAAAWLLAAAAGLADSSADASGADASGADTSTATRTDADGARNASTDASTERSASTDAGTDASRR